MLLFMAGMLIFSVSVPAVSYLISKPDFDRGRSAASVALVAWGSLCIGLLFARFLHG